MAPLDPPWLAEVLACPRCHQPLALSADQWNCDSCGVVGARTLGFPDFLVGVDSLPVAGGGFMRLSEDTAAGADLAAEWDLDFAALAAKAAASRAATVGKSGHRRRACDRFHCRLRQLNLNASKLGGQALLSKVDGKIAELGWPALDGDLALEAGGGAGFFLPAFSRRFKRVVFVDASLPGLVLAARLCREQEIDNVTFIRADVTALPLARGRFDMVHENGVIEHVSEPGQMLTEARAVRSVQGYLICVSPNRFTVAVEPHSGIPLYGAVPAAIRRRLVPVFRGLDDGAGTDLLSLRRLRGALAASLSGDDTNVFFLPRRLPFTARQTPSRRLVMRALATPGVGGLFDRLVNGVLLGLAPQHIAISREGRAA